MAFDKMFQKFSIPKEERRVNLGGTSPATAAPKEITKVHCAGRGSGTETLEKAEIRRYEEEK